MEKATAIVLRVVEWSETSAVVTLFTREAGLIRGLAKGARRPKGPFESALDVLSLCRVVFLRKSSGALDLLTEAKLLRRFRPGRDLSRLYGGYYVAELLVRLTHDYDPHPELFDAAEATLAALGDASETTAAAAHVMRFEVTLLHELGYLPQLEACVECGTAVAPRDGRLSFGLLAGGVLCPQCRPGKRQVVALSASAWQTLRDWAQPECAARTIPDRKVGNELRSVLNHYINNLLGSRPRLQEYQSGF